MAKGNNTAETIKLDQILKVLFKLSKKLTINLLNVLFHENFKPREVTIEYGNAEFAEYGHQEITGDMFIDIHTKDNVYRYHIEFQTLNDSGMVIRMFEYGYTKAKEIYKSSDQKEIKLKFPKQLVIFIEENKNIADHLYMTLELPDGQEIKYTVPVMKYWKYTPRDLEEQKMYVLLPLQVFRYRKNIKDIYKSRKPQSEKAILINQEFEKLKDTIREVLEILDRLDKKEEIQTGDLTRILEVLSNITKYLYEKYGEYGNIEKEVDTMIKSLYDPAVKEEGIREGIKQGMEEGMEKGIKKGRIKKAKDNILSAIKAKFDMVPEDLKGKILKIDNEDKLDEILLNVIKSSSIDEIYRML